MRLYYATPSAEVLDQVVKRFFTVDGAFDVSELAEFAGTQFDVNRIKAKFNGISPHSGYGTFATTVCSRLGIGRSGEGQRALGLLARVQAGREFTTVDMLFKTMVLDPPKTLSDAKAAVDHFADLEATYDAMKTAEDQVKTLDGIVELRGALEAAQSEIETIDSFGLQRSGPTPFGLWALQTEDHLLEKDNAEVVNEKKEVSAAAQAARRRKQELDDQIEDLRAQQRAAGGDEVESIERRLTVLTENLGAAETKLTEYARNTGLLGTPPRTGEAFAALRVVGEEFIAQEYPARKTELEDKRQASTDEKRDAVKQRNELETEVQSLKSRSGLMTRGLHEARLTVAAALGCPSEELPFVGELIDMDPDFEEWRFAADRAVRSFATVMLVDANRLRETREKVNNLKLSSRLNFQGVDLGRDHPAVDHDRRTLPGRFITSDSPFSGWVLHEIGKRFNYICVNHPADLSNVRGITITGQTSDGMRGAHGGLDKPIIGFSSAKRQAELSEEITALSGSIQRLEQAADELQTAIDRLDELKGSYIYLRATSWESIDVAGIEAQQDELKSRRERILGANNRLAQLKAEEEQLTPQREEAHSEVTRNSDRMKALETLHGEIVARHDEVKIAMWEIEEAGTVVLSDELSGRLKIEFDKFVIEPSWKTLPDVRDKIRASLGEAVRRAEEEIKSHADALQSKFGAFLRIWPRPDLGEAVAFYDEFHEILTELKSEGLHERRARFTREVNEWSGVDLLKLHGSYTEALNEIEDRLNPINDILKHLPFGAGRDRLALKQHYNETPEVAKFRRELRDLASNTTELDTDEAAANRFVALQRFIGKLRTSERDHLIDVRRHVSFEAERVNAEGITQNVYVSIAGKSGGESQELIAFIVGAALRYQLGDEEWPRYAPVVLDEAFIKSDESFTGRAVDAWQGLGFQLIVGAPDDKVNSIERHTHRVLCVTKNDRDHSHITELRDAP